jgi:hypothetical protein
MHLSSPSKGRGFRCDLDKLWSANLYCVRITVFVAADFMSASRNLKIAATKSKHNHDRSPKGEGRNEWGIGLSFRLRGNNIKI